MTQTLHASIVRKFKWDYEIHPSIGNTAWEISNDGKIIHASKNFLHTLTGDEFKVFNAYCGALCYNKRVNNHDLLPALSKLNYTDMLLFASVLSILTQKEEILEAAFIGTIFGLTWNFMEQRKIISPEQNALDITPDLKTAKSAIRKTLAYIGEPYQEALSKLDKLAKSMPRLHENQGHIPA